MWRNLGWWQHQQPALRQRVTNFRHPGDIKYIDSDGKVMKDYSWWKDFKDMWAGFWDAWSQFKLFDGIADHNIAKYAQNLKKNIEE